MSETSFRGAAQRRARNPYPRSVTMDSGSAPAAAPRNDGQRAYMSSMEWTDEGIVLGVRRHGETSVILELMTHGRGRHLGLVRGGSGARLRACCSPAIRCAPPGGRGSTTISATIAVEGINLRAAGFLAAAHAGPRGHASRGLVPSARGTRAACGIHGALEAILDAAGRSGRGRADGRALRAGLPRRARFRARSCRLRRHRRERRSRLCFAALGPRRLARRRRALCDKLMRLPRFLRTTRAGFRRRSCRRLRADRLLSRAPAFAPRGLALPDARARFVAAVLVRSGQPR